MHRALTLFTVKIVLDARRMKVSRAADVRIEEIVASGHGYRPVTVRIIG